MEVTDANSTILLCINKSQSINEIIHKGVAPVPSNSVRPSEMNESKKFKNHQFKKIKTKRKNKSSIIENTTGSKTIELAENLPSNVLWQKPVDASSDIPQYNKVLKNIEVLSKNASGSGFINSVHESDGFIRKASFL